MSEDTLPRPFPGAIALSALALSLWVLVPSLNRIDITWHFWAGIAFALAGLLVAGFFGESPRGNTRTRAAALFALALVASFLLLGAALQLPPPEMPPAEMYDEAEPAGPSPTQL